MNRNGKKTSLTAAVFGLLLTLPLAAQDAPADGITGLEVMEQVYRRPVGDAMQADLHMTITNSRGAERDRSIVQFRSGDSEVEKKIMFFTAPADVRNTSFLSFSYADGKADDRWIYLPALRRVKRIAADNSGDAFMGSDFTYDDMGARNPSADTHTILKEEIVNGQPCYVVESVPIEPDPNIAKTVSWVVKDVWIGLKKEFIDQTGSVTRRLTVDESRQIDNIWVITDMTMRNLEKGTSTRITMDEVSFSGSFSDSFFSERQMRMGPRL
jgi:hypothetical protein